MAFSYKTRLRYSECGSDEKMSILSAINYLQDCSSFQSEKLGLGTKHLREQNKAWLLNGWHIKFDRYPEFAEEIEIGTYAYQFKGIYGLRYFYIADSKGVPIIRADSLWFLWDNEKQLPARPDKSETELYLLENKGPELNLEPFERKLKISELGELKNKIKVTKHFLDSNNHVNNARYVEMAADAAMIEHPVEIKVEYRKAAVLNDDIYCYVNKNEEGYVVVALASEDQSIFAVVYLKEER
ncbi:MAG: thioesterase [Eubacteriales bacterium]|nr:thioesterase [Eubacteriales bacterium]